MRRSRPKRAAPSGAAKPAKPKHYRDYGLFGRILRLPTFATGFSAVSRSEVSQDVCRIAGIQWEDGNDALMDELLVADGKGPLPKELLARLPNAPPTPVLSPDMERPQDVQALETAAFDIVNGPDEDGRMLFEPARSLSGWVALRAQAEATADQAHLASEMNAAGGAASAFASIDSAPATGQLPIPGIPLTGPVRLDLSLRERLAALASRSEERDSRYLAMRRYYVSQLWQHQIELSVSGRRKMIELSVRGRLKVIAQLWQHQIELSVERRDALSRLRASTAAARRAADPSRSAAFATDDEEWAAAARMATVAQAVVLQNEELRHRLAAATGRSSGLAPIEAAPWAGGAEEASSSSSSSTAAAKPEPDVRFVSIALPSVVEAEVARLSGNGHGVAETTTGSSALLGPGFVDVPIAGCASTTKKRSAAASGLPGTALGGGNKRRALVASGAASEDASSASADAGGMRGHGGVAATKKAAAAAAAAAAAGEDEALASLDVEGERTYAVNREARNNPRCALTSAPPAGPPLPPLFACGDLCASPFGRCIVLYQRDTDGVVAARLGWGAVAYLVPSSLALLAIAGEAYTGPLKGDALLLTPRPKDLTHAPPGTRASDAAPPTAEELLTGAVSANKPAKGSTAGLTPAAVPVPVQVALASAPSVLDNKHLGGSAAETAAETAAEAAAGERIAADVLEAAGVGASSSAFRRPVFRTSWGRSGAPRGVPLRIDAVHGMREHGFVVGTAGDGNASGALFFGNAYKGLRNPTMGAGGAPGAWGSGGAVLRSNSSSGGTTGYLAGGSMGDGLSSPPHGLGATLMSERGGFGPYGSHASALAPYLSFAGGAAPSAASAFAPTLLPGLLALGGMRAAAAIAVSAVAAGAGGGGGRGGGGDAIPLARSSSIGSVMGGGGGGGVGYSPVGRGLNVGHGGAGWPGGGGAEVNSTQPHTSADVKPVGAAAPPPQWPNHGGGLASAPPRPLPVSISAVAATGTVSHSDAHAHAIGSGGARGDSQRTRADLHRLQFQLRLSEEDRSEQRRRLTDSRVVYFALLEQLNDARAALAAIGKDIASRDAEIENLHGALARMTERFAPEAERRGAAGLRWPGGKAAVMGAPVASQFHQSGSVPVGMRPTNAAMYGQMQQGHPMMVTAAPMMAGAYGHGGGVGGAYGHGGGAVYPFNGVEGGGGGGYMTHLPFGVLHNPSGGGHGAIWQQQQQQQQQQQNPAAVTAHRPPPAEMQQAYASSTEAAQGGEGGGGAGGLSNGFEGSGLETTTSGGGGGAGMEALAMIAAGDGARSAPAGRGRGRGGRGRGGGRGGLAALQGQAAAAPQSQAQSAPAGRGGSGRAGRGGIQQHHPQAQAQQQPQQAQQQQQPQQQQRRHGGGVADEAEGGEGEGEAEKDEGDEEEEDEEGGEGDGAGEREEGDEGDQRDEEEDDAAAAAAALRSASSAPAAPIDAEGGSSGGPPRLRGSREQPPSGATSTGRGGARGGVSRSTGRGAKRPREGEEEDSGMAELLSAAAAGGRVGTTASSSSGSGPAAGQSRPTSNPASETSSQGSGETDGDKVEKGGGGGLAAASASSRGVKVGYVDTETGASKVVAAKRKSAEVPTRAAARLEATTGSGAGGGRRGSGGA